MKKTIRLSEDGKKAIALARSNDGELQRFGDGAWATFGYKWRGHRSRNTAHAQTVGALVRMGVMHLGGFVDGKATIASLVDYRKRRRGL